PETCTGSAATCPADTGLPDGDGDGTCDLSDNCPLDANADQADGDGDDTGDVCDPCTNGAGATKATRTASKLLAPGADDKLSLKGEAVLPPSPPLDPLSHGVRLLLTGAGGTTVLDVTIPGGTYDAGAKTGWKVNGGHTTWTYKGPGTTTQGIQKVGVKRTGAATPN